MADRMAEGKYAHGDAHHASRISDEDLRALREDYWNAPHGQRSKIKDLAARYSVDYITLWRWLHGEVRPGAGGPVGEIMQDPTFRTNHSRGEQHSLVTVPDAEVRALREEYWNTPRRNRLSLAKLAAQYKVKDTKTVWNWLHGKHRISAGGPTGEIINVAQAMPTDTEQTLF
ncbi:hypothetical protein [Microbispora rosea]|uniref:hypothetical protein n=1 Tax=Microbispora rosea TaxID=58117 RepID=UPI003D8B6D83